MTSDLASTPAMTQGAPNLDLATNGAGRVSAVIVKALAWFGYVYVVVVEAILLLGFILLLFGANPTSSFVRWAYRNLDQTMRPFRGIFAPVEIGTAGNNVAAVLDTSVLFAMVIYGVGAVMLTQLQGWLSRKISRIDTVTAQIVEQSRLQDAAARTRGYSDASAELFAMRQDETARRPSGIAHRRDQPATQP